MADEPLTPEARATPSARIVNVPAPVRIGILYVVARAVTAVLFVIAGPLAPPGSRFGADPSAGVVRRGVGCLVVLVRRVTRLSGCTPADGCG